MNTRASATAAAVLTTILFWTPQSSLWARETCGLRRAEHEVIRPVGHYKHYAFSSDPLSFKRSSKEKQLPQLVGVCEGFVQLYAQSAQTRLYMPFGWEAEETGNSTLFWTPDERTRIILRFTHEPLPAQDMQTPEQVQAAWKTAAIETIRTETSQMKAKAFEIIPSSVDEVAFKLIDVPTESGRTFVQVLTFNDVRPDFPMSISLTTPSDTFDKICWVTWSLASS